MPAFSSSALLGAGLAQRSAIIAVGLLAGGAVTLAPGAAKAELNCSASLNNTTSCPRAAFLGETIIVDFASVIAANPNLFSNDNTAWEYTNTIRVNTTNNGPLNVSNARLIGTGKTFDSSGIFQSSFVDQQMVTWAGAPSSGSSGVSNYSPSIAQGINYRQASFTLSPTGTIVGRNLSYNSFTSLKLVLENATLSAEYPNINVSLGSINLNAASPTLTLFGANATLGVPAPLPLAGGAMAFGWSRRLRRRLNAAKACA
jgi:hypothetical protein